MEVQLEAIPEKKKSILKNLLELYSYDFTEFVDYDINEEGSYGYPLERYGYWSDPSRHAYFIRIDEKLAGFVLLRTSQDDNSNGDVYSVTEFFILRKYRRHGVGRKVAQLLFEQFKGKWRIDQIDQNYPSNAFWRMVIDNYTDGHFEERHERGRTIHEFRTD